MLDQFHLANELTSLVDHALMWTLIAVGTANQVLRRHTWRIRWEVGTTTSSALVLTALTLLSPWLEVFNPFAPNTFSYSHISAQFLIGHIVLMVGYAVFLGELIERMEWGRTRKDALLNSHLGVPLTVATPTLIGLWVTGWHTAITPVAIVVYVWQLAHICWLFWRIRKTDPRSPLIANLYLIGTAVALAAPLTFGLAEGRWPWRVTVLATILWTVTMSLSWTRKQRHLKAHMWKRIRAEKPLRRKAKRGPAPKQLDGAF
ncbi:hypothetical protein J4T96_gp039 [Mycobacterium phage Finemlucis]|uniref:Uncharacterized protein n=1 Tax=Mycobacterium phage Finemlucis TaxID=2015844 RepID=A0A291I9T8_9CAUD|nr:hypothetical protein J4T96_gp039 [Mycobacterium phage Finemlucis]ATG86450.1 hypothetical protein SEA_FINEMLUCIS_39 [Mycobacterium phage Finemlucis]